MTSQATYLYRCTEQQLEPHLQKVADAGDTVEHVIYKGGRDYVLVCRKAQDIPVTVVLAQESIELIAQALARGIRSGVTRGIRP